MLNALRLHAENGNLFAVVRLSDRERKDRHRKFVFGQCHKGCHLRSIHKAVHGARSAVCYHKHISLRVEAHVVEHPRAIHRGEVSLYIFDAIAARIIIFRRDEIHCLRIDR